MYTLKDLQDKNFKELKEIGFELNVKPEDDRRVRQNWINALVGVELPLLQLLEVPPAAEVEPIVNSSPTINGTAIEVQRQEPIEIPPGVESKFGRIVYPKPAAKPIAQNAESRLQLDRTESADVHNRCPHPAESVRDSEGDEAERLGSKEGDRVLALAGNHQAVRGGVLPHQPIELIAAETPPGVEGCDQPPGRGDGKGRLDVEQEMSQSAIGFCAPPVTFSSRFLATYPPYFGEVHYRAEETGQLNLLESVETDDEPPDPDDFELLEDFRKAIAIWDAQHPEPLEVSLDSMCEWAPCPDEWYEPVSSSITFSIPTFDAWRDRQNRQNDSDEPPDTGIYARLPGPKPPKFPPCVIPSPGAIGYSNKSAVPELSRNYPETIPKLFHSIAAGSSTQPARSPPGGDAM